MLLISTQKSKLLTLDVNYIIQTKNLLSCTLSDSMTPSLLKIVPGVTSATTAYLPIQCSGVTMAFHHPSPEAGRTNLDHAHPLWISQGVSQPGPLPDPCGSLPGPAPAPSISWGSSAP